MEYLSIRSTFNRFHCTIIQTFGPRIKIPIQTHDRGFNSYTIHKLTRIHSSCYTRTMTLRISFLLLFFVYDIWCQVPFFGKCPEIDVQKNFDLNKVSAILQLNSFNLELRPTNYYITGTI